MKKIIDLSDTAIKTLKAEAKKEGRSFKKHLEYLLEQRAIQITDKKKKQ